MTSDASTQFTVKQHQLLNTVQHQIQAHDTYNKFNNTEHHADQPGKNVEAHM
jgi:hypothetical protein